MAQWHITSRAYTTWPEANKAEGYVAERSGAAQRRGARAARKGGEACTLCYGLLRLPAPLQAHVSHSFIDANHNLDSTVYP